MINSNADWFFNKPGKWQGAYQALREIVLGCGLTEELKWGHPCYTRQKSNIVLIHGFKNYCALLFMQGALLKDPRMIFVQQKTNVQSARQFCFGDIKEIQANKSTIKAYIREAIKNNKK